MEQDALMGRRLGLIGWGILRVMQESNYSSGTLCDSQMAHMDKYRSHWRTSGNKFRKWGPNWSAPRALLCGCRITALMSSHIGTCGLKPVCVERV